MDETSDHADLDDVVRGVVELAQPEKIKPLGPAAWNRMAPRSDLDLPAIGAGVGALKFTGGIRRTPAGAGPTAGAIVQPPRIRRAAQRQLRDGDSGGHVRGTGRL